MAIDSAEKRRAISGIPFLVVGVTPDVSKDSEWRREAAWNYPFAGAVVAYVVTKGSVTVTDQSLFSQVLSDELVYSSALQDESLYTVSVDDE